MSQMPRDERTALRAEFAGSGGGRNPFFNKPESQVATDESSGFWAEDQQRAKPNIGGKEKGKGRRDGKLDGD